MAKVFPSKMSLPRTPKGMALVCAVCRWRPRLDQTMTEVEDHFATSPDHNADDLHLELVAWCFRCQAEMPLVSWRPLRRGHRLNLHRCPICGRAHTYTQGPT